MAASYYFQWQEINEWLKNNYPSRMDLVEILETLKAIKGNNLDVLSIERLNQVKMYCRGH